MAARARRKRQRRDKGGAPRASRFRRRQAMALDGYLAVGRILGAHGLRGEVKVESHTDFDSRFAPGQRLLRGEALLRSEIATARPHKGIFLLRFHEIADRDAAESLYNEWLYIPEAEAMELEEGVYWAHDLIGLTVQTEGAQRRLGEVVDVLFTGANEVYIVRPAPGVNREREVLLPALAEVIRAVDLEAGVMTVRLPPGLLEEGAG